VQQPVIPHSIPPPHRWSQRGLMYVIFGCPCGVMRHLSSLSRVYSITWGLGTLDEVPATVCIGAFALEAASGAFVYSDAIGSQAPRRTSYSLLMFPLGLSLPTPWPAVPTRGGHSVTLSSLSQHQHTGHRLCYRFSSFLQSSQPWPLTARL